ncbi:small GTP-binding protein [Thermodesulfatator indicus DSM 15286]|uniref:Elongation factor G n=1 Tax=Thermodesulfatator indicus (strain DSM 15286 / JCM 11887 / CIR29812) TaxID=667014 RepID=F8AAG7_THEID|nr:elongation factor G [Thermodesulfatator indicus]AEH45387.1 small GTP-binding protein [Thermodesulfatator indicus DSM 15286]
MEIAKIRNLVLLSQSGAGKTSLAEAMLFIAGKTGKLGRVDEGSSILDFEPEEQKRKITISTACHHFSWKKHEIFFLDPPGDDNFNAETKLATWAADNALLVIDATAPVKVQTEKVFAFVKEFGLPCAAFINKLDREHTDFDQACAVLEERLEIRAVPVAYPIGREENLSGIVDLLTMKAYEFSDGKLKIVDMPSELEEKIEELRANLIEYAAESDDDLLEKFLEEGELTAEEIVKGLKRGILEGRFVPVSCGSVDKLIGIQPLLDLIVEFLPSPVERGPREGKTPEGEPDRREPHPEAPISLIIFKTFMDPYAGRLSFARIVSGTLKKEGTLLNPIRDVKEKYANLAIPEGKEMSPCEQAVPGMFCVIPKLSETKTGDTLCDPEAPIIYPMPTLPHAVLTYALHPESRSDEEKIGAALVKLQEEDPSLVISRDEESREILLSGLGQIHIEATIEKLSRKYGVNVKLSLPKIPYRETIKKPKEGVIYRHKKQTGGRGQFAEVHFNIYPLPRGQGFEFVETLVGMNVPRNFVPAVEKGVRQALEKGPLAGYPVVDVKVQFYDGKSHEVDSSDMAFMIAASQCFKKGIQECQPILLEPIMELEIEVPDDVMGDVIGDINARRGRVLGMEPKAGKQVIMAQVPLAEVQRYALDLNAITGGRGTFRMKFSHYEEVPPQIAEKIMAEAKEEEK